jgi:hypothetical protein
MDLAAPTLLNRFMQSHEKRINCVVCRQSERLAHEGSLPITSREARDTVISDIPGLPSAHPSDFLASFLNPVMYSWMKYHHYRLGRANVILVNTFYEIEKQPIDAVRNEVLGTPYVKVSVA